MSIKEKMAAKTAAIAGPSGNRLLGQDQEPKTGPGKFMAAMPLLAEKNKQLETATAENEELRAQLGKVRGGVEISLRDLVEVEGRRRHMPPERYAELRDNLRRNPLVHPVVVRALDGGKYEIVSGHHRVDAYRELGRELIRAVVSDEGTDEASDGAFYANLMQSDLTDYEKYLGFRAQLARHPEMTQSALAEQVGVVESTLSYLLSFDNLPPDVLSLLAERPDLLGAKAGSLLASLTKQGQSAQVVAAVNRLAAGEIDQGQAVKLAGQKETQTESKPTKPVVDKVKSGKATYCEMRRAKNVMRISFQSEAEAERVHEIVRRVLAEQASKPEKVN